MTAPSASAAQFVGALAPLLPPRAAAAAACAARQRHARFAPHDGGDHDRRAAATQTTKRVEERVRDVPADEAPTRARRWRRARDGPRRWPTRARGCSGWAASRRRGGRGGRTRAQAASDNLLKRGPEASASARRRSSSPEHRRRRGSIPLARCRTAAGRLGRRHRRAGGSPPLSAGRERGRSPSSLSRRRTSRDPGWTIGGAVAVLVVLEALRGCAARRRSRGRRRCGARGHAAAIVASGEARSP